MKNSLFAAVIVIYLCAVIAAFAWKRWDALIISFLMIWANNIEERIKNL